MNAAEMEDVLRNLDRRVQRAEQILPTLATKDDLAAFATKEDLKAFATKEDLKVFATKDELKAGLEAVMRYTLMLHEQTREDIQLLAGHVADLSQRIPPRS